jgi:hypothetical protein
VTPRVQPATSLSDHLGGLPHQPDRRRDQDLPSIGLDRIPVVIIRYGIRCPGCDEVIHVRLSVYPCEGVKFYFPCPECEIPITGNMRGEESIDTFRVNFDNCNRVRIEYDESFASTVTVAPNVPLKRAARSLREVGGAPNAMILHVAGDSADKLTRRMSYFYMMKKDRWPNVQRFYEYYMRGQWDRFLAAGRKAVGPTFTDPGTAHGRESEAYRAVTICTLSIPAASFDNIMTEIIDRMESIFSCTSFRDFAIKSTASGDLQREQRRIWDCICLLMKTSELWFLPGLLWELADENPGISRDELWLALDEFHQIRDAYVACFEACCKAKVYVVAFINSAERGAPEVFTSNLPPRLVPQGRQRPPRTFAQFKRLPNYEKLAYLYEWPKLYDGINQILDNRLRNAIGHNSARHDLRTGMIVSDDEAVMSYVDFTAKVYGLYTALHIVMNILHSVRMAATEPALGRGGLECP